MRPYDRMIRVLWVALGIFTLAFIFCTYGWVLTKPRSGEPHISKLPDVYGTTMLFALALIVATIIGLVLANDERKKRR